MSHSQAIPEHDVETYLRVSARLDQLDSNKGGMPVKTKAPLSEKLEKLSCFAVVPLPLRGSDPSSLTISVAGKAAGTMEKPDVDMILQKSTASPFGKGERTVLDTTYRRGREIPGADIKLESQWGYNGLLHDIQKSVSATMFIGRDATLKLYKLAVYTDGGHFDWHMDSTHSDRHHATVLLALNTSWAGGDLVLRRNGVETRADMKPNVSKDYKGSDVVTLQAVAFYTDTEHKVEPVSKGLRIVLQYDVEVSGWSIGSEMDKVKKGEDGGKEDEEEESEEEVSDIDSDDMDVDDNGSVLKHVSSFYFDRKRFQRAASTTGDPAVVKDIISILSGLLNPGVAEVGFALQYLYRKSSILPEFLKGSDALLYRALIDSFDVSLHPVMLCETTDYDGSYEACYAYRFDNAPKTKKVDDKESDRDLSDRDSSDGDSSHGESSHGMEQDKPTNFYVPKASAVKLISSQEYLEHTGNEAQPAEYKYFGGGMFVRKKSA